MTTTQANSKLCDTIRVLGQGLTDAGQPDLDLIT